MNIKKSAAAFAIFLTMLTLAGCNADSAEKRQGRTMKSFAQIDQEYQESLKKLNWPQGYAPPASMSEFGESDTGGSYQSGWGDTVASNYFECAWEREWLKTYATDQARAAKALEELEKLPSMGFMSKERADDSVREFFKETMDKAKLGDPSGFEQNVKLNCPE